VATIGDLMRSRARFFACLFSACLSCLGSALAADEFSFPALNKSYKDLVSDFVPVRQGPVTLTLSSPSQTLTIRGNRAVVTPRADGTFDGRVELDIMGKGFLAGDIDWNGTGTRLQDELILVPQTVVLEGRARIARATGGYNITALSLPADVKVRITSKLSVELVNWCDRASLLPFSGLDCRSLENSLSEVTVPLPAAGEGYFLSDAEIGPAERQRLDALLERAR
jgi:hypothetical protein